MPVDAARCRIVRERISPPSYPLSPPQPPSTLSLWMCGSFYRAPPPSSSSPPPPPTPPPSTLLRFLPPPSSPPSFAPPLPFLAGGTWLPGRRSVRPHPRSRNNPARPPLSRTPFLSSSSSSTLLSSLLRCQSPRCILNQSLGGNAITRHHDASTIFYFKLLYVLVPPPCLSPVPRFSSTARSTLAAPPSRYVSARHTTGFAALLFCLGSSRALSLVPPPAPPPFLRAVLPPSGLPPPPSTGLVTRLFY